MKVFVNLLSLRSIGGGIVTTFAVLLSSSFVINIDAFSITTKRPTSATPTVLKATVSTAVVAPSSSSFSSSTPLFSSHFNNTTTSTKATTILTYLEINGWLLTIDGITILIDPILEGDLDFGLPSYIYSASKRKLPSNGLFELLPPIDCLLITQGLDDHAHERTLKKLASKLLLLKDESENDDDDDRRQSVLSIIAPPSARDVLIKCGFTNGNNKNFDINYIQSGDDDVVITKNNDNGSGGNKNSVKIKATAGALVGPPWQARENGYIIRSTNNYNDDDDDDDEDGKESKSKSKKGRPPSVYIEPHVEFNPIELQREKDTVDIVITPISGQGIGLLPPPLPGFELVHGPNDAIRLVDILQPKYVIPMQNGDVDTIGAISPIIQSIGSSNDFQRKLLFNNNNNNNSNKIEIITPVIPGKDMIFS
jgi:L-ascorbate metabolism protein UlaG (beta-lactamase superfamily)